MNFFKDIEEKVQKYIDNHISNHIDRFINPRLLGTILVSIVFICILVSCIKSVVIDNNILYCILIPIIAIGGYKFSSDCYKIYKDSEDYNYNSNNSVSTEYESISCFKQYAYFLTILDIIILIVKFIFKHATCYSVIGTCEDVVFIVGLHLVCTFPKPPIFYYRGKLSNV